MWQNNLDMRGDEFNSKKRTWNKLPSSEFSSSSIKEKVVPESPSYNGINKDTTTNEEIIAKEGKTWTKVSSIPETTTSSTIAKAVTSTAAVVSAGAVAVVVGINVVPFTSATAGLYYLEASASSIAYGIYLDDHQEETPFVIKVYNDDYVASKRLENGENYGTFDSLSPNRAYQVQIIQDKEDGVSIGTYTITTTPKSDFLRFDFPMLYNDYEGTFDVTLSYVDDENLFSDFILDLSCPEAFLEATFQLEKTTKTQTLHLEDFYLDETNPEFTYDFHFMRGEERVDYASGTFTFKDANVSSFGGVSCEFVVSEGGHLPLKLSYEDTREYYNDPTLHLYDGKADHMIPLEMTNHYQLVDVNNFEFEGMYGNPLETKVTVSTPEGELTVFHGTRSLVKEKISKIYEVFPVDYWIYDNEFSLGLVCLDEYDRYSNLELNAKQGQWSASYTVVKQEYQAIEIASSDIEHFTSGVTLTLYGNDARNPEQRIAFYKEENAVFEMEEIHVPEPSFLATEGYTVNFHIGDSFTTGDLKVILYYDDGSQTYVEGYTVSTPDMTEVGAQDVTVTYQGFTATYTIVIYGVRSIEVVDKKETWKTGDYPSEENFEVTATYEDDTTAIVSGYSMSFGFESLASPGTYEITFTYYDASTTLEIHVTDATVISVDYYDEATRDDAVGCKLILDATEVYKNYTKEDIEFDGYILMLDDSEDWIGYSPDDTTAYEDYDLNLGEPFRIGFDLSPAVQEQPFLRPGTHTYSLYCFAPSSGTAGGDSDPILLQTGQFEFGASIASISMSDEFVYLGEGEDGKPTAPFHFALEVIDTESRWSDFRLETFEGDLVATINPSEENVIDIASFASQAEAQTSVGFSISVYDSVLGGRAEILQIGTTITQA